MEGRQDSMRGEHKSVVVPETSSSVFWSDQVLYMISHVSASGPDFPTSLVGVRHVVQELRDSDCMVNVDFVDVRSYNIPLTVFLLTKNAIIQGLQRCTHLNGLKVQVVARGEVCESEWAETTIVKKDISCLVRRVKGNGNGHGNLIRLDNRFLVPTVLKWEQHTLSMVQKMTRVWTAQTKVIVGLHSEQLEIQRLTAEYWANSNKFCKASPDFHIVCGTYVIDMAGLSQYLNSFDWSSADHGFKLESPGVLAKVSSFVDTRLTGTNLNIECAICMEPRRKYGHIRLGCPCGEVGSVKGAVLHLKCAMTWLLNQEKLWGHYYETHDQPSQHGMDSPSCPFCKSRLLGLAPDMTSLALHKEETPGNEPDPLRMKYLEHMNFLLQARFSFPEALRRVMIPDTAAMLMHFGPALTQEMTDTACISFPHAATLFLSNGDGRMPNKAVDNVSWIPERKNWSKGLKEAAEVVMPPIACSLPYQSDDIIPGLNRYNNMVYYIAVACELRFATQCQNNREDRNR